MENYLADFSERSVQRARESGCEYCDARSEITNLQKFVIENGDVEHITTKVDQGIGIRVLADGAWGFFSIANPKVIDDVFAGLDNAVKSAKFSAIKKKNKIRIKEIPTINQTTNFPVRIKSDLESLLKIGFDCDKIIREQKRVIKSITSIGYSTTEKYFVNSEGSKINQNYTDTVADLVSIAHESGLTQSVNTTEGGRGGIEKLLSPKNEDIMHAAKRISSKSSQLIDAKPAKEDNVTVVMNPDFVALLTHEILGHPSEADRVLGREMAWAGGAWWAGKLGEKIGSDILNVFDDPTITGSLGWYNYDDEGVKAKRTDLIKDGTLTNHMQSRETATIFDSEPNSNMRATSFRFMPLIRMACTCINEGNWSPDEMIKDTKNGYLISHMKIPSIDMKRYNWSISCQYAQKIENGELGEMLRDVIVLGTAPEFFKSIDACGNDFTIRPITNCGKGDPMQSMIMGNGGPSIRAVATVKSVGK